LHGFPDTAHTWDHVRPALARAGFRAVSPFMRGYTPTEIPAEEAYESDTLGKDVLALIEALGERYAIVVGHDWGASAAYSAAGLGPERIRFLVTMAIPHPAGVMPTPALIWSVRHFFKLRRRGAADALRKGGLAYIDELWRRWSPGWDVPASATALVKESFAEPGRLEAALGYYRALRASIPLGQRKKVSMPAAAFAGTEDNVSPNKYERVRSRYLDRYEVVRVPGGHFMHRQHPEDFTSALLRVLEAERARWIAPAAPAGRSAAS